VTDAEIGTDGAGVPLVRTRIEIAFTPGATVAELNALIDSVGGRIISMLENVASVVVLIPDPGSGEALDALVAGLEAAPQVRYVRKAYLHEPGELPTNYDPVGSADLSRIDHALAIRAPAAWDARAAIQSASIPTVVVHDWFGDGPPDAAIAATAPAGDFGTTGLGDDGSHGYHVLGTIAAAFGGPMTDRGVATGMFPATVPARVIDRRELDSLTANNLAIQALKTAPGNAILNTSIGYVCGVPDTDVRNSAVSWIEKVRGTGLEDRTLHLTAAGNIRSDCPEVVDAETAMSYAAAALLQGLEDATGAPVPNLTNVLAVENAVNGLGPDHGPICLNATAKYGGHLAGIGTDVWSLTSASTTAGNKTGASMATPQVAGLAAYLWAIDPTLTPQALADLLTTTAVPLDDVTGTAPTCNPTVLPAPVVDAYAAALSLDQAVLPTPATAPVRRAILDAFGDGPFDEFDLEAYLIEYIENYVDGSNHGAPREPTTLDWGRFDLNGDGVTGGSTQRPFDLDRVGSSQYGPSEYSIVAADIDGRQHAFDERNLTDLEILCYYAYSRLYTGIPGKPAELIDPSWCNPVELEVTFSTAVQAGSTTPLFVRAFRRDPAGEEQPLAGAVIELNPSGGTVGDFGGVLDAEGFFETTATPFQGPRRSRSRSSCEQRTVGRSSRRTRWSPVSLLQRTGPGRWTSPRFACSAAPLPTRCRPSGATGSPTATIPSPTRTWSRLPSFR
jgi:hypothetical protein